MMVDADAYESMELRTTITTRVSHFIEDEYGEVDDIVYEWSSEEKTFKGRGEIEGLFYELRQWPIVNDKRTKWIGESVIDWRGKEVKCDLTHYGDLDLSIVLLEMIWERDGEYIMIWGDNWRELLARIQEFYG